jgi:hypothetical protein
MQNKRIRGLGYEKASASRAATLRATRAIRTSAGSCPSAEIVPIARCTFSILIDHRDDRSDMLRELFLLRCFPAQGIQRPQERRDVRVRVKPAHHHKRPPRTRRRAGGASAAFRRLRSPTRSSSRATCRESTSSASAVGRPACFSVKMSRAADRRAYARARSLRGSCRYPALFCLLSGV